MQSARATYDIRVRNSSRARVVSFLHKFVHNNIARLVDNSLRSIDPDPAMIPVGPAKGGRDAPSSSLRPPRALRNELK